MKWIDIPFAIFVLTSALVCSKGAYGQAPLAPISNPLVAARALLDAGQLAEAEASIRSYLNGHGNSADGHFLLGYVLFREEKAKDSLAEFTAGAAFRRPDGSELKTVASDYVLLGDFSDADKWYSEVTSEKPEDVDAWYLLGRTKYNEGRYDEAASSFERALKLRPMYVEAENNLGLCWHELNQLDRAKSAFQTAIDWEGKSPSDSQPYLNLGALLVDQSEVEAAITNLSKAVALSPQNPKIHEELGAAYEVQSKLTEAQEELEKAVALAPNSSGLHFKLANLYRKEGLREQAKHEFEVCAKLNSTHSSTETPNPFLPAPAKP
jgi:tetratricopeptide (TPR) repeat protein